MRASANSGPTGTATCALFSPNAYSHPTPGSARDERGRQRSRVRCAALCTGVRLDDASADGDRDGLELVRPPGVLAARLKPPTRAGVPSQSEDLPEGCGDTGGGCCRHRFTGVGDIRFRALAQAVNGSGRRHASRGQRLQARPVAHSASTPGGCRSASPAEGPPRPLRPRVNRRITGSCAPVFGRVECACALRAASCDAPGCAGAFDSDGARPAPLCTVEHQPEVVPGRRAPIEPGENRSACRRLLAHDHRAGIGRMKGAAVHPLEYSGRATMLNSGP